uniref:Uncharacterized protein n=1 Tax=Sphaerodactylus townsendi TaxID=933632 RepID=A0ACB8E4Z5_9SAUR
MFLKGDSNDSSSQSEPAPEEILKASCSVTPAEDRQIFSEHLIQMAQALKLSYHQMSQEPDDPVVDVFTFDKVPIVLPLTRHFQDLAKANWNRPASHSSQKRLEGLYRAQVISAAQASNVALEDISAVAW